MKRIAQSAIALLLLACPCFAEVRIAGELKVPANHMVRLAAEGDVKGAALVWDVTPEDAADVEEVGGRLLFTAPAGTYKIKLLAFRAKDGATVVERARATVVIGESPPVPPGPIPPGPTPPPTPPTPPAPIPVDGFRVLIVFESENASKLPPGQQSAIYGKTVRDYLEARCAVGPDGRTREYRIWDKDVAVGAEAKHWQEALKRPRPALPYLIVSDGKTGFEGPLPATVAETLAILKKIGG